MRIPLQLTQSSTDGVAIDLPLADNNCHKSRSGLGPSPSRTGNAIPIQRKNENQQPYVDPLPSLLLLVCFFLSKKMSTLIEESSFVCTPRLGKARNEQNFGDKNITSSLNRIHLGETVLINME